MDFRTWTAFALALTPGVLLLLYIRRRLGGRDRLAGVRALVFGALGGLASWITFSLLEEAPGLDDLRRLGSLPGDISVVYTIGVVAAVEETAKALATIAAGGARRASGEAGSPDPMRRVHRAMCTSGTAGLGFAIYENYLFAVEHGASLGPRLISLPVLHLLFSLVTGLGIVFSMRAKGAGRLLVFLLGLSTAGVLHGAYDQALFSRTLSPLLVVPVLVLTVLIPWIGIRWIRAHPV